LTTIAYVSLNLPTIHSRPPQFTTFASNSVNLTNIANMFTQDQHQDIEFPLKIKIHSTYSLKSIELIHSRLRYTISTQDHGGSPSSEGVADYRVGVDDGGGWPV
jgi:hypothetical protein